MKEKTIHILGKDVRVRYCAAAENGFEQIRSKSIYDIDFKRQEDVIALAISAIVSAYSKNNEEPPITAEDLLYDATPTDLVEIVKVVVELRNEWYSIPSVVEKLAESEEPEPEEPKNA